MAAVTRLKPTEYKHNLLCASVINGLSRNPAGGRLFFARRVMKAPVGHIVSGHSLALRVAAIYNGPKICVGRVQPGGSDLRNAPNPA